MKSFIVFALAFLAGGRLWADDYEKVAEKKIFNGEIITEFKLKNGLRVLHVPRTKAKVLTYQIWFDVGSNDEKLDPKLKKTGLAHLFEHMMFRGTKKYPDGKFDEIVSRLGGDKQNATTYYYRTNYFESVPSHQIDKLMEIESDRMQNLVLTKELFEKEKGAVVGELRRHLDRPSGVAWDEIQRQMFHVAPFQFTVLGSEAEIKGFTLEEGQYFYKTFYAPNNATIIVVGDIEAEKLLKLIVKYYGDMKPQEVPKTPMPVEPPQKKERRIEKTHPQATSDTLIMAYRIPEASSSDIAPLSLLSTHLSTGMESRLRKALVDKGIAVGANAGVSNAPDLFEFSISLAEGHRSEEALKVIDREIALAQAKPISASDFERAVSQEKLSLYQGILDNSAMANWLGENLLSTGNYMRGFEIIDEFSKTKPKDLQRVAKKYLVKKQRGIVIMRPAKKEGKT